MRYKAQYHPSWLVCPVSYAWTPVDKCKPLLDRNKFCKLNESAAVANEAAVVNVDNVLVLFRHQMMPHSIYRELRLYDDNEDDVEDDETAEVREYAALVSYEVSKRMLLYRP